MDESIQNRVSRNWHQVQQEVREATVKSGRDPDSVTIVGVSKYVDVELTSALVRAGCEHLGESRPQSLWGKAETFADQPEVHWHLIGHLQRNKIRRTLSSSGSLLIHSVDSDRLLDALVNESVQQGRTTRALLEVNISEEPEKTGLRPPQLVSLLDRLPTAGVQIEGLMAMAGWGTDRDQARRQFDKVFLLRQQLRDRFGVALPELSMGMSGDFREAIAAGATMVRIGSRLFDGLIER